MPNEPTVFLGPFEAEYVAHPDAVVERHSVPGDPERNTAKVANVDRYFPEFVGPSG
jgi:hypothetical protein